VGEGRPFVNFSGGSEHIGSEFLLWLWFQAETRGGVFQLEGLGQVGGAFDALLEMTAPTGGSKVTVRGDHPTRQPEAEAALRTGRVPVRARLLLARDEATFELTLDAATFDVGALKLTAESADAPAPGEEQSQERAALMFELPAMVDALFALFLQRRTEPGERTSFQGWLAKRPTVLAASG